MRPANSFRSPAKILTTLILALSIITLQRSTVSAHSWLDCTDMRDSGCAGFPLGYPSRGDIDINTKYTYLVQDRRPNASVCQPGRQNIPGNNPLPIASVTPGQNLHLTWQPDGHLDDSNPSTIEIHWSGVPDQQLHTRSELTPSTVLGTMIFATSANCDVPSEPNTWCHGHLTIPEFTKPGTYQLVWWWKYDRNPHGEEYSTCFEINVSGGSGEETTIATLPPPQQAVVEAIVAPVTSVVEAQMGTTPEEVAVGQASVRLELAYLTEELAAAPTATTTAGECPSISVPVVESAVNSFQDESLADLISQPDALLTHMYNNPTDQIVGEGEQDVGYNAEAETGDLAGDAVNDEEDRDTSPQPLPSPSQLITCTVDSVLTPNNGTVLANSTIGSNNSTRNNSNSSNTTSPVQSFRPDAANSPSNPHNQTLASLYPLDSGSAGGKHCIYSGTLVATSVVVAMVQSFFV